MRAFWGMGAAAALFTALGSCSTYDSMFSDAAPKQAQSVEHDRAEQDSTACVRVASERADDATMANYVNAGSAEQQDIYQATYRDCLAWHDR